MHCRKPPRSTSPAATPFPSSQTTMSRSVQGSSKTTIEYGKNVAGQVSMHRELASLPTMQRGHSWSSADFRIVARFLARIRFETCSSSALLPGVKQEADRLWTWRASSHLQSSWQALVRDCWWSWPRLLPFGFLHFWHFLSSRPRSPFPTGPKHTRQAHLAGHRGGPKQQALFRCVWSRERPWSGLCALALSRPPSQAL